MTVAEYKGTIKETSLQQQFVRWFSLAYPTLSASGALFSVPNEGKRSRANASRMKAEGMVSGVADMILLCPLGEYHGAVIEFKRRGEKPRTNQAKWLAARASDGYLVLVFDNIDTAISVVSGYMSTRKKNISI